jgi:hypothetical protein
MSWVHQPQICHDQVDLLYPRSLYRQRRVPTLPFRRWFLHQSQDQYFWQASHSGKIHQPVKQKIGSHKKFQLNYAGRNSNVTESLRHPDCIFQVFDNRANILP